MTVNISKPAVNVRPKLAELDKPTGIAGEAMLRAETPQEQFNLIGAGRRNLIINGNFQVSQRGDFTTASGVSNQVYYLDRWIMSVGISGTIQDTGYKAKVVCTSTGSGVLAMSQNIEDKNIHPLKGKTVTVSCKVTSNSPNARIVIYADDWLSLGNQNDVHSGSGNEETLSATFTVPSTLSGILQVRVGFDNEASNGNPSLSANDYFEVSDVQLELGKVATPFEHRSYGEELALCQRYYWTSYPSGYGAGSTGSGNTNTLYWVKDGASSYATFGTVTFPSQMRTTPTTAMYNPTTGAAGQFTSDGTNTSGVIYYARNHSFAAGHSGVSVSAQTGINYHVIADAEL